MKLRLHPFSASVSWVCGTFPLLLSLLLLSLPLTTFDLGGPRLCFFFGGWCASLVQAQPFLRL